MYHVNRLSVQGADALSKMSVEARMITRSSGVKSLTSVGEMAMTRDTVDEAHIGEARADNSL